MAVIVLGMHRSGTSAVARLVQDLGVDVGSHLLPATEGNIHGHFEEAAFIRFHDGLITRFFPKRAPYCEWLPLADAEVIYTEADRAQAAAIWRAHGATGGTGWKDPRTSLFLDLWIDTVPDAKVVVCLRHPYQVHRSLLRRGESFLHVDYSASIAGWTVYNQRILKVLANLPRERFVVLDVETAFREPCQLADGLAHFLGLPPSPGAFAAITPDAFHFEADSREALEYFEDYFPEAGALYRRLRGFDLLHPKPLGSASTPNRGRPPDPSDEIRLLEFEEAHGLRAKARKMLIRSVTVDRQRMLDLYQQAVKFEAEKDRLIEDLSRLNGHLKARVAELEKRQQPLA